ncbi:MAG: Gfo/Idh/MocA family oxidoreductase [Oscillospiraceae bacterium]|nr:Gfo/Idh/MocA family oxidoreductase [Oscillospiraceae bacterium]
MDRAIKFGVIGLGRGKNVLSDVVDEPSVELCAICDKDEKKIKDAIAHFDRLGIKDIECFEDFDEMLKTDIDAVYIATDAIYHVPFAIKALDAGKHVISEIPAVNSLEEARMLKKAVSEHPELKYMCGENCCYWGNLQAWKEMYDRGKIGETVYAESEYFHSVHDPEKFDEKDFPKEHWRSFNPAIKYLTHNLGPLLYIMDDRCVSVSCMVPDVKYNPFTPCDNQNGIALFKTAKGAVIRIFICFGAYAGFGHNFRIIGTRGTLETDITKYLTDAHSFARFHDVPGSRRDPIELNMTIESFGGGKGGHGGADKKMLLDFVKCIVEDTKPPIDVELGIAMALPGIIASESAKQGGVLMEIPEV